VSEFKVFVLPDAEAEIAAAFSWYLERNPQAAEAFRAEVLETIDSLSDAPTKWKLGEDGTRRRVLRHFPYTVFFDVEGDSVFVLAVAHQRRAPGYWRTR
jgi:plasmid stabilization system protein ParE